MDQSLERLRSWYRQRRKDPASGDIDRVTLGQLRILLELLDKQSIAASSQHGVSDEVNRRQKLARLEAGLGVGALTKAAGNRSRLSETGRRIASEFKLLLDTIQSIEGMDPRVVHVAAGDTWTQSVVMPAIWQKATILPSFRWKVSNMESDRIVAGVRAGEIHFGLIRRSHWKDDRPKPGELLDSWKIQSLSLVVGSGVPEFRVRDGFAVLKELLEAKTPWVQHEGTWRQFAEDFSARIKKRFEAEPLIECGTHLQAAHFVVNRKAWCIVPSQMVGVLDQASHRAKETVRGYRVYGLPPLGEPDKLQLIQNPRVVSRGGGLTDAASKLRVALGRYL